MRSSRSLLVLLVGGLLAGFAAGDSGASELVVTGVTLIPMDRERVLPDRTVVIRDGRIAAVGTATEVAFSDRAEIVDGSGKYLIPGLIDTHVHFDESNAEPHLLLYLAHGVTTVQSMHGSPWHLELRRRVADGEIPGPAILTTGPTTSQERVDSPEKAEALVRAQKDAGYDAVKQYGDGSNTMTPETYHRLVESAHEAGLRVVGHAPRNLPFAEVLAAGQDSIDHMEEIIYTYGPVVEVIGTLLDLQFGRVDLDGAEEALASLADLRQKLAPAAKRLAREAKEAGLAVTPTLVAFDAIWRQTTPDYDRLLDLPELRYVDPVTRLDWGPEFNGYRQGWSDRLEAMDQILGRSLDLQKTIVAAFQEAGVPILTGTDAPLTFVVPGFSLHRELALLVEAGLTPYEALRAATAAPAAELGLAEEAGIIAVGRRADLVLLDGNPLDDITQAARIAGVIAAGTYRPAEETDEQLAALAASYEPLARRIDRLRKPYGKGDAAKVLARYRSMADDDPALAATAERMLNELGYSLLGDGETERAVEVFLLAAEGFPESANAWDSLGEGQLTLGKPKEAEASYRRALELDPDSESARGAIDWVRPVLAALEKPVSVSPEELRRFEGDYGPRHVELRGEFLYYRREGGDERRLLPLGEGWFALEGLVTFRMEFEPGEDGRASKIIGHYIQGHTDESPRD